MTTSTNGLLRLKRLVPAPLKRRAKAALLSRTFRRAVAEIDSLTLGEVPPREVLERLQVGWGNEGFAAQIEYLEEVARRAATTAGPILECGSGLTTILMGLLAGGRGVETWSLEHVPDWRARVVQSLEQFEICHAHVCSVALRDYEGFSWYDAPLEELPKEFQLVICDGPPGATHGGRYGLLPVLGARLPAGSVILLDDATRLGEAEVLRRWVTEARMDVAMHEARHGSFAVITRNRNAIGLS
jgi:hypothetical protein